MKKYYTADLSMEEDWVKFFSWVMSMLMASMSLALLGQGVQMKWRFCFFIFCGAQLVLRVFSLMALSLMIYEHCEGPIHFDRNGDPINREMQVLWEQPKHCGRNSEWGFSWLTVVLCYTFLSMMIGVVFHVIHLQGLSGGSIMNCQRIGHKTEKEKLEANPGFFRSPLQKALTCCMRLTIFNQKIVYTWIIGLLNLLIAFDCSPFSILKNAEPRPPRLPFALFRAAEVAFACVWFEANLRKPTPTGRQYFFDFDAIALALGATSVIFYLICLVVPHQQREPLGKSVSRAVSVGLARDQSGIYRAGAAEKTEEPHSKPSAEETVDGARGLIHNEETASKAQWENALVVVMMACLVMMLFLLAEAKPANKITILEHGCGGYCKNGGECMVDKSYTSTNRGSFSFFCHCTANYTGSQCEYPARSLMEAWEVMSGCEYTLAPGEAVGGVQPGVTLQANCENDTAEPAFTQLWHGGHLYRRLPLDAFNETACGARMASSVMSNFG